MSEMNTLVIGDVHGHFDRLEALLMQEGVIGECHDCDGTGDFIHPDDKGDRLGRLCPKCDGAGIRRVNRNVKVVQLGDLGHFGSERSNNMYGSQSMVSGSPTADLICYEAAVKKDWIDHMTWGNHDRAVVDSDHEFSGYIAPPYETVKLIEDAHVSGKLKLAHVAHGYLLTHAGLHKSFKHQKDVPDAIKEDPQAFADWINAMDFEDLTSENGPHREPIRDNIGKNRGGWADAGGILWRDATEGLYPPFKQVFGHTRGDKVRKYKETNDADWSWCVDIGDQFNGQLCGIWLPDLELVYVNLNAERQKTLLEG